MLGRHYTGTCERPHARRNSHRTKTPDTVMILIDPGVDDSDLNQFADHVDRLGIIALVVTTRVNLGSARTKHRYGRPVIGKQRVRCAPRFISREMLRGGPPWSPRGARCLGWTKL